MIAGLGTDIVAIPRMRALYAQFSSRLVERLLAPEERAACLAAVDPPRFLAKRFAAKEAFGKALGTGLRSPARLVSISVVHDALGKPAYAFDSVLTAHLQNRNLVAHLSLSDEREYVVAVALLEYIKRS